MGVYLVGDLVYTLYYILLFVVCIFVHKLLNSVVVVVVIYRLHLLFMFEEEYSVSYFTAIFHNYNTFFEVFFVFSFYFLLTIIVHFPIFQSSNLLIFYPYIPHTPPLTSFTLLLIISWFKTISHQLILFFCIALLFLFCISKY